MADARWIKVLWARSARYQHNNLVGAWADSLAESLPEEFDARVGDAKEWFLGLGDESDGPWEFWISDETVTSTPKDDSEGPHQGHKKEQK